MQRVGMRNIKTALSVFISIVICHVLKLEFPFYAGIAAVIVMGLSIWDTIISSKNRLIATIVGGVIGIPFAIIMQGNFLVTGIGIIIIIYICNLLKCNKSINIACVVFIYNMINLRGKTPLYYTSQRFIATLIGVITAIAINYLILPLNPALKIKNAVHDLLYMTELHIKELCMDSKKIDIVNYEKIMKELNNQILLFRAESRIKKFKDLNDLNIDNIYELFNNISHHFRIINELENKYVFSIENINKLNSLFKIDSLNTENMEPNKIDIIFNYHLEKVLENYINLKLLLHEASQANISGISKAAM